MRAPLLYPPHLRCLLTHVVVEAALVIATILILGTVLE